MNLCTRSSHRVGPGLLPVAILAALITALALPGPAPGQGMETLASLDARYERLVRAETDLLEALETSARRATDRNLILIGGSDGPITEMSAAGAADWLDGLMARVEVLGLDRVYLGALSPWEQMIVAGLHQSGLDRAFILERLQRDSVPLRAREAENAATIAAMLDEVRAEAAALQARREALRVAVARGDGSDLSGAGSNPVCLDDAVPVDHRAIYWASGYGGGPHIAVKGAYICRAGHWFDLIAGDEVQRWECAEGNPHDCRQNPDRSYAIRKRRTDDQGREVLELATANPSTITLYLSD